MSDTATDVPEPIVMSDLAQAAMMVCAARHDDSVDHDAFTDLVYTLVDHARAEERERLAALKPPPASPSGTKRAAPKRTLTDEDVATIKARCGSAPRSERGHLIRGFKQGLAADLGLTTHQIEIALHKR